MLPCGGLPVQPRAQGKARARIGRRVPRIGHVTDLTDADLTAFRRDGYLVLRGAVPEDVLATLDEAVGRFLRNEVPGMGRDLCDMSAPYDRPFEEFAIVNAMLPRRYLPSLQGNGYETRATAWARQLVGQTATLDYDQFLVKKPRRTDAVFAWHQDLGYWPTGTPDTVTATFSLALDDADEATGCLRVVPGSQREPALRPHRPAHPVGDGGPARDGASSRERSHILVAEVTDADEVVPLPVRRGDVTVHDERIVHGSSGNATDRWRRTCVLAFRSAATVAYERSIGFTHSHGDRIAWETHLGALAREG